MKSRALEQIAKPVAEDLKNLGSLLRDARTRRGFTQAELARRLQVSPTTVRSAERGDPRVAAGILASIAWLLGLGPISTSLVAIHPQARLPRQRVRPRKSLDDF